MKLFEKQNNSVLKASILFTFFTFLQPALNFFLLPLYLNYLSEESYSIYTLVSTITFLISAISGLKISSAVIPFFYSYKTDDERYKMLSNIFSFNLLFNIIFLAIILLIGPYLASKIIHNELIDFYPHIFVPCLIGLLAPLTSIFIAFTKNKKELFKYGFIQLSIILTSTTSQFILITKLELEGILYGKLIGNIIGFLVVCIFIRKVFVPNISYIEIRKYLTYSIGLIPFFFVFWIGRYADRFLLERYVALEEVGVYGLLMTFTTLITLASEALANSIQPFLYEEYQKDLEQSSRVKNLYSLYLFALLFAGSIVILITYNINLLTAKKKYLDIIPYIFLGIIPALLNGMQYFFFNVLTFHKKSKLISAITIITVGVQIFFIFLLIEKYRINGLLISSILGNLVAFSIYYLVSRKYVYKNLPIKDMLILLGIFIFSVIMAKNINMTNNLIGLLFPLPLLVTGIIRYRDIIRKTLKF